MVSIIDKAMVEYRGLSTDTKPAEAANGSSFLEMDTGVTYYYDADSETWVTVTAANADS